MSSILKALKKVEKEKGAHQGSASPISREILNNISRSERKSGSRSRLLLIFLALLGGGILGGMFLMQDGETPPAQTVQRAIEPVPVVAPEVPAEPPVLVVEPAEPAQLAGQTPVTAIDTGAEPSAPTVDAGLDTLKIAEELVSTTRDATAALKDTATSLRDTADALKNKVIMSSKAASKLSVTEGKPALAPVAIALPTPLPNSGTASDSVSSRTPGWYLSQVDDLPLPNLNVNEIHWRPVAKDRLAVVNGLPVLEGVDIEGARVDRIFKDRIRFLVNGRYLEVKVSAVPAP